MNTHVNHRSYLAAGLLAALGGLSSACSSRSDAAEALSKSATDEPVPNVPVPAADGPKLYILQDTPVLERPSATARPLGEVRAGAVVARSVEPYSRSGCDGGWYVVRPKGFVCAGSLASPVPTPAHMALGPDLSRALPFRYGRARSEAVPVYARVPSPAEQIAAEPDLVRHLAKSATEEQELFGAASNDVPLDAHGVATGPAVLQPGNEGVDASSKRTNGAFFTFVTPEPSAPAFLTLPRPGEVKLTSLRKGSGVALMSSFLADAGSSPRRFGVTADGHVVPTDRLRPALGSTWHGIDLTTIGLPVAFVHKRGVHTWHLTRGKASKKDDEVERRTPIAMSGKFRTVDGVRYEETRDGDWFRSVDIMPVVKKTKFPDFARAGQKWLDISLVNQTLTAYEGTKPIYATLISSGRDQGADGTQTASTVKGVFHVKSKSVSRMLDNREVHNSFDIADAPWVMEFDQGSAITGSYWGETVGEASTFHNVLLTPIDARRIWAWADPELPEGWSTITDAAGDANTMINIRP
jgi:hypothetical protein